MSLCSRVPVWCLHRLSPFFRPVSNITSTQRWASLLKMTIDPRLFSLCQIRFIYSLTRQIRPHTVYTPFHSFTQCKYVALTCNMRLVFTVMHLLICRVAMFSACIFYITSHYIPSCSLGTKKYFSYVFLPSCAYHNYLESIWPTQLARLRLRPAQI